MCALLILALLASYPTQVAGASPAARAAGSPLDLHVRGRPCPGETLELVVTGPASVAVVVLVERAGRAGTPAEAVPGLLRGTLPARPETLLGARGRAGDTLVLAGWTDERGSWSHAFAAPEAGTRLLLRGFGPDAEGRRGAFEALELDIAPAPLDASEVARSTALSGGGPIGPGASAGGSTPLDPGQGVAPCSRRADVPDLAFEDANCDGIDGDRRRAVFVATSGAPGNPGTMELPLESVQVAIQLAALDPARDHVYVSEGTYAGRIDLLDGVSVFGGYSAAHGWQRSGAHVTTLTGGILAGNRVGILGTGLARPIVLGGIEVVTGEAPARGHSYGILLQNSDDVRLEGVRVVAGAGGAGVDGVQGNKGSSGTRGGDGNGSSGGSGGGGANAGGAGGHGGTILGGDHGLSGAGSGNSGGAGGAGGPFGTNGSAGGAGRDGAAGAAGGRGANDGQVVNGLWSQGGDGTTGGIGGVGSGGGGGGGGGYVFFAWGGGGGGGGGGGYGGTGGTGGRAGGSSFALFLGSSHVTLEACELTAGLGRDGGNGGAGGERGDFGQGGSRATPSGATTGGHGAQGGYGGRGGAGGGGGGGHSYALLSDAASSYQLLSAFLSASSAGAGGSGGTVGLAGQAALIREL